MSRSRSHRLVIILLPLLALLCLGSLLGANLVLSLPSRAEAIFGPPTRGLSLLQTLRYSALLLWQAQDLTTPTKPGGEPRAFTIQPGESVPSITGRLWQANLIGNPGAFRTYLLYSGLDRTLQAGEYTLSSSMSALQIGQVLQDATPARIRFRVLAGWRAEEIAATLPTSGLEITPDEFLQTVRDQPVPPAFITNLPEDGTLEGFLFPDGYEIERTLTATELIATLLENFDRQVTPELRAGLTRQGLDLHQGVTLASIVQREAVVDEEAPLIASVFLNRLAIGMKLDADPTVQYAVGYNAAQGTWWTNPISAADLKFDSAYNTYLYPGLPPGPIANPGLTALRAVAFPARTPYYYFRAACDDSGRHVFAETFEEHRNNACP